jgi:hypothetical protein
MNRTRNPIIVLYDKLNVPQHKVQISPAAAPLPPLLAKRLMSLYVVNANHMAQNHGEYIYRRKLSAKQESDINRPAISSAIVG